MCNDLAKATHTAGSGRVKAGSWGSVCKCVRWQVRQSLLWGRSVPPSLLREGMSQGPTHTPDHGCPRAHLTHNRSWMSQDSAHTRQVMSLSSCFFFFLMQLKDRYFSNIRVLEITSILLFSLTKQNRQKNSVKKKKKFSP